MLEQAAIPGLDRPDRSLDPLQLAELEAHLLRALPGELDDRHQEASLALYRLLAAAGPVTEARLARYLGSSVSRVKDVLAGLPEISRDGNVISGHLGLTRRPTAHRFEVDGRTLYTWCAFDTLFIPALLDKRALVRSTCPVTGETIRLTVTPAMVESVEPSSVMLSFRQPAPAAAGRSIIDSFCCHVLFFRDAESGGRWTVEHPGTFLINLESAFALGRCLNEARYPEVALTAAGNRAHGDTKRRGVSDE